MAEYNLKPHLILALVFSCMVLFIPAFCDMQSNSESLKLYQAIRGTGLAPEHINDHFPS